MHVQIVSFSLIDMDEDGYVDAGAQLAPAIAEMPGLIAKLWLADPERNAYGGVYLWRDRAAMDSYASSALFKSVTAFPHFAELVSRDFAVHEDLKADPARAAGPRAGVSRWQREPVRRARAHTEAACRAAPPPFAADTGRSPPATRRDRSSSSTKAH